MGKFFCKRIRNLATELIHSIRDIMLPAIIVMNIVFCLVIGRCDREYVAQGKHFPIQCHPIPHSAHDERHNHSAAVMIPPELYPVDLFIFAEIISFLLAADFMVLIAVVDAFLMLF